MRLSKLPIIAAIVALAFGGYIAFAESGLTKAVLHTASGDHTLSLELATTPEERETGLMNRESLAEGHGMLFEFDAPSPVNFWMKNTLIPLDILFLDPNGVVTHIATNAKPMSLDLIPSDGPAQYVLELNGGAAAKYGVSDGDRLETSAISAK